MLSKLMSKLGWYLLEPQPDPTHGMLEDYTPLSQEELLNIERRAKDALLPQEKQLEKVR